MPALEILTGFVTAPDTTLTALTMATGDSLTIRNAPSGASIKLLQAWADEQTAGILQIRSPRMHDDVQGIRLRPVASEVDPLLPMGVGQELVSQDTLRVLLSGSATAGDIETAVLLIHYEDLPGISGKFIDSAELQSRMVHLLTVENTLALGTSGGYSGSEAINAEFDLFKGNTEYAIVGYSVSAECAAIGYRSSDFGNLRVGGPGNELDKVTTNNWFKMLSEAFAMPLIPVFNSANIDNVLVDGAQDENGTDVTVNTILAQLTS